MNLEEQWAAPYGSAVPEIVALRTAIEQRMGTPASPGPNPIEVLLNLHSSHNVTYPFHFRHSANASFDLVANRSGVLPSVNALETRWPKLERIGSDQIVVGDRVAFLIEIGSDPESFARELRTGFVAALDERSLTVELDPLAGAGLNPNEGARTIIPRGAVLGWSRANAPQRRVAIEWTAKPDDEGLFVRHVEIGQPITLAIPEPRAGLRWSIEPAAANFRVLGVDANNLAQVVFDRGSRSGRFHVRLHADDPGWGSTALGHWAFQLRGVS